MRQEFVKLFAIHFIFTERLDFDSVYGKRNIMFLNTDKTIQKKITVPVSYFYLMGLHFFII